VPVWALVILGVVGAALIYAIWTYNGLVSLGKRADGAWSDIDVQLKRRWDLVPALVETVKGYARHESETFEETAAARMRATMAQTMADRSQSEQSLGTAVSQLFALAESYPELKASANFLDLQKNLVSVENHLQYARRYYNAVVRDLNTLIEGFPAFLVARVAGFTPRPFFQLEGVEERTAPRIDLGATPPAEHRS
jgi:LemA protein